MKGACMAAGGRSVSDSSATGRKQLGTWRRKFLGRSAAGTIAIVLSLAALTAGCGADKATQPALGMEQSAGASFDEDGLETDTLTFIALDDPRMVPASQADWIDDDDIVLGFVHSSGEAHAFPTTQMSFHHVANITVAGTPYLVTY